jgi:hypothetical protein
MLSRCVLENVFSSWLIGQLSDRWHSIFLLASKRSNFSHFPINLVILPLHCVLLSCTDCFTSMKLQIDLQFHVALVLKAVVPVTATCFSCGQVNFWPPFCCSSLWEPKILRKLTMKHQICLFLLWTDTSNVMKPFTQIKVRTFLVVRRFSRSNVRHNSNYETWTAREECILSFRLMQYA